MPVLTQVRHFFPAKSEKSFKVSDIRQDYFGWLLFRHYSYTTFVLICHHLTLAPFLNAFTCGRQFRLIVAAELFQKSHSRWKCGQKENQCQMCLCFFPFGVQMILLELDTSNNFYYWPWFHTVLTVQCTIHLGNYMMDFPINCICWVCRIVLIISSWREGNSLF